MHGTFTQPNVRADLPDEDEAQAFQSADSFAARYVARKFHAGASTGSLTKRKRFAQALALSSNATSTARRIPMSHKPAALAVSFKSEGDLFHACLASLRFHSDESHHCPL